MTEEVFQQSLREFKYREPFVPFVVEMDDGRYIEIDNGMSVGFIGGEGVFFSPDYEIIEFDCQHVRSIRSTPQETAS